MSQESQSQDWSNRRLSAFEAAWQAGTPPEIADFLPPGNADSAARRRLLIDLVMIDLEYRWRRHGRIAPLSEPASTIDYKGIGASTRALPNRPVLEHYIKQYAELGALTELPDELIAYEFRVRRLWGDRPSVNVYWLRFGLFAAPAIGMVN